MQACWERCCPAAGAVAGPERAALRALLAAQSDPARCSPARPPLPTRSRLRPRPLARPSPSPPALRPPSCHPGLARQASRQACLPACRPTGWRPPRPSCIRRCPASRLAPALAPALLRGRAACRHRRRRRRRRLSRSARRCPPASCLWPTRCAAWTMASCSTPPCACGWSATPTYSCQTPSASPVRAGWSALLCGVVPVRSADAGHSPALLLWPAAPACSLLSAPHAHIPPAACLLLPLPQWWTR